MCLIRAVRFRAWGRSSPSIKAIAERSSWMINFSQSSVTWCWMMKSSSS
jgi:hypothetical protein